MPPAWAVADRKGAARNLRLEVPRPVLTPVIVALPAVALDELKLPSPRTTTFFPRHCERPKEAWQSRAAAPCPGLPRRLTLPRNDGGVRPPAEQKFLPDQPPRNGVRGS